MGSVSSLAPHDHISVKYSLRMINTISLFGLFCIPFFSQSSGFVSVNPSIVLRYQCFQPHQACVSPQRKRKHSQTLINGQSFVSYAKYFCSTNPKTGALMQQNRLSGDDVTPKQVKKVSNVKTNVNERKQATINRRITTVGLATMIFASATLAPLSTFAQASTPTIDPFVYTNEYEDPLHPLCKRRIEVAADGKTFHYSGTAVGPKGDPVLRGCTNEEIRKYKLRQGAFDGFILSDGKISAGDGIHEGIWEPANTVPSDVPYASVDGVRWNDGNKWTVKTKSTTVVVGEAIFYSYIGFSTLAGMKGLYDGIMRKKREADEQLL